MEREDNALPAAAQTPGLLNGIALCGMSTHQSFVFPDQAERQKNIDHTLRCIEIAYELGIPTIRVNTGRWGTITNFDELMKQRGEEPTPPGRTDEEALPGSSRAWRPACRRPRNAACCWRSKTTGA